MESATTDANNRRQPAERRACARLTVNSLIFVKVGDLNGGIAFNISEDGLALSAANYLPDGQLPTLWIQLPESGDWIRAEGQIAWRGNSNKEAGIRFVGLPEHARQRIKDWSCSDSWNPDPALELRDLITPKQTQPEGAFFNNSLVSLDQMGSGVPERSVQRGSGTSVSPYCPEAVFDRRIYPRKRIVPLGYIQLGASNGGIALNVSEGGLAITAAMVLLEDHLPSIRLQFPDAGHWVDVQGEIVWKSGSKREAGVRFVGLTEEARLHLKNWISSPTEPGPIQKQAELISAQKENQKPRLELPSASGHRHRIDRRLALGHDARQSVESFLTPVAVAGLTTTDSQVADPHAEISPLEPSIERNSRVRPSLDHGFENVGKQRRVRRTVSALVALIALVLLMREWIMFRPNGAHVSETVTRRQQGWTREPEARVQPPGARTSKAPQAQVETMEQPAPSALPPLRENSAIVSVPSAPPKTPPRRVDAAQGSSAGAAVRDSIGNAQDSLAPNQATAKVPTAAAPVTKPAWESNRSQVASTPPASWPQQDVRVTTPLTSVVSPPREAVSAGLENRTENRNVAGESPSLPKRAQKPAIVSGTVAILTDPYPSIRLPHAPSSKKSRRGTSLQLGQLIARVEPAYPEEAKQQGIEGTVKMHVLVSREGIVQQLVNVDGPALLVPATVHAVQQWRYTETMLAGQAVETEDDIAVTFRLANHGAANK
jgi:hypothetical protein